MPRFNFRLQQYLGVKEQIEDQKELEYSRAVRKLEEEKAQLRQMLTQLDEQIEGFRAALKKSIAPIEVRRYNSYIERLKQHIRQQEERVKAAEVFVETKRQELVQAMKERKALEAVRENAHEEFVIESNLAEQKHVDELVSFKYAKQSKS